MAAPIHHSQTGENTMLRHTLLLWLLLPAITLLALLPPSQASAWVQTASCVPNGGQYACAPGEEPVYAHWPHRGIYYWINREGSADVAPGLDGEPSEALVQAVIDSFEAWNDPACSNLKLVYRGLTNADVARAEDTAHGIATINVVHLAETLASRGPLGRLQQGSLRSDQRKHATRHGKNLRR